MIQVFEKLRFRPYQSIAGINQHLSIMILKLIFTDQ